MEPVFGQGGLNSINSATDEVNPWNFIFDCLTKDLALKYLISTINLWTWEKFGKLIFRVHLSLSLI